MYRIECVMMSVYNFRTNKMIKHEHKSLINELSKMTDRNLEKWINLLFLILWMNQIIIKHSINWTLYELLYDYTCVLFIETHISTWTILIWNIVQTQTDLLAIHVEQLLHYDIDLKETATYIQWIKKQSKEHINDIWNTEDQNYKVEDLVLLYNSYYKNNNTADHKLKFWWLELY